MAEMERKFEEFEKTWRSNIEYIKSVEEGLDRGDARTILLDFGIKSNSLGLVCTKIDKSDLQGKIDLLETDLVVALASATSRYKLKHRSIWATIFGGFRGGLEDIIKNR